MANINFSSFFTKNKGPQNQGANNSNNYQSPYFPQQVSHLQNMQTQQMNNQNVQRQPGNYPYQQVSHNNVNQQSAQRPVVNNYNNQANVQQPSRPVYTPQTPVQNTGNNVVQDPNYTESSFDKELGFLNNVKRNIPVKTEEEKNEKEVNVNVSENPFVVQFPEKKRTCRLF
ncbi:MAG: hypothetical protein PHO23_02915 [Candidatus Pacebacteria bacterium]|nr:hypothetical protein [Candidatus Paceibacterota bacterium]